jgi:hypothetical protein
VSVDEDDSANAVGSKRPPQGDRDIAQLVRGHRQGARKLPVLVGHADGQGREENPVVAPGGGAREVRGDGGVGPERKDSAVLLDGADRKERHAIGRKTSNLFPRHPDKFHGKPPERPSAMIASP